MKKSFQSLALIFSAAAGIAGTAYYLLFRRPLPQRKGSLRLSGLEGTVDIRRDPWGVPHIYAASEHDLFFAQGFIHAEERLWQMEFNRRLVAGRVSEILGPVSIQLDRWMRTIGMRRVAEQEAAMEDCKARQILQAYAEGVNARIAQGRFPVEFNLLRFRPEPWVMADSLAWSKMMAWTLSVNWEAEILRAMLVEKIGPEKAAELEPGYFEEWPLVIPKGVDYSVIGAEALQKAAKARQTSGPGAVSGLGSNNWVLSGSRTASGKPLLANDMHLGLTAPAIWFENHLVCQELNVTGVSLPGIPGVIAGHNEHVAWGFTNGFPDVQDLYMEHLRRGEDDRVQYEYKTAWLEAEVHREIIQVRGQAPVTEEVVVTRHGPIINSLCLEDRPEQPLALRWTALEPSCMIHALYEMNRAGSCLAFREALRHWHTPVQNTVYADTQGNIGYSYPGKVPIRRKGDGRLPVPGWTGEYEWEGYIPFDELPHQYNPGQGFIATANNRVVGSECPHWLGFDCVTGNRAQRITELINQREKIDVEYIRRMHSDLVSAAARVVNGVLAELQTDDPELKAVLEEMQGWNGELGIASAAACVYEVFCLKALELILTPRLGKDLAMRYMGKGPTPVLAEGSIFAERSREFLQAVLANPTAAWFDLGKGEQRDDVVRLALRQTVDFLKDELGPAISDWQWGKLHTLTFMHVLGAQAPLNRIFNSGPFPIGGDGDTIWNTMATRFDLAKCQIVGPPFRMIVDFSDLSKSLGQLVPGQSGHPASPHYADNVQGWLHGEYHPILFRKDEIERATESQLRLEP